MSMRRTGIRLGLTLAVCAALAACATQPQKPTFAPAVITPIPVVPAPPVATAPSTTKSSSDQPWAGIVASDVMQDCANSPLIRANAAMYTRSPARFEQLLKQSLPLIIYVHEQLQQAGIPGEFSMLPMLESSYNPAEPSRHGDPAGMWQMMPRTAHLHGVKVNRHYDGRLDPVASTKAAIKMLKSLQRRFGDWRLVDMAYNAGPYAIMGALRDRPDATDKPIPDLPVSHATRTHLARLMALSCIIRQPRRFHVELPKPTAGDELAAVTVPAGTRLKAAAGMAEISEAKLRKLNPGYRGTRVPDDSPRTLLLPTGAAESLTTALVVDSSESVAQVNTPEANSGPSNNLPLPAEPTPPAQTDGSASAAPRARHHRVRDGETLWSIAHRYHVSVRDLKRWNDLRDSDIHPGEELRVRG
ncbi:MAG: LysM peptidoglycan-binding domain-containing protein [Rhodanobacteraceae bacterium]|nr:MAG: LysM peptidoglycan-binding domain-containing protein [Rhodanobacteraceae bacterium]